MTLAFRLLHHCFQIVFLNVEYIILNLVRLCFDFSIFFLFSIFF